VEFLLNSINVFKDSFYARNSTQKLTQTVRTNSQSACFMCIYTRISYIYRDISQAKCRLHFCTEFSFPCVCVRVFVFVFYPQLRSICVRVSASVSVRICECAKHSVSEPKGKLPTLPAEKPHKCTKNIPKKTEGGKERGIADIWTIILYQHITESKHHLFWFGSLIYGLQGTSSLSASAACACIFVVHLVDTSVRI